MIYVLPTFAVSCRHFSTHFLSSRLGWSSRVHMVRILIFQISYFISHDHVLLRPFRFIPNIIPTTPKISRISRPVAMAILGLFDVSRSNFGHHPSLLSLFLVFPPVLVAKDGTLVIIAFHSLSLWTLGGSRPSFHRHQSYNPISPFTQTGHVTAATSQINCSTCIECRDGRDAQNDSERNPLQSHRKTSHPKIPQDLRDKSRTTESLPKHAIDLLPEFMFFKVLVVN